MKAKFLGDWKEKLRKVTDVSDEDESFDYDENDDEYDDYDSENGSDYASDSESQSNYDYKYSGSDYVSSSSSSGYDFGGYTEQPKSARASEKFTKKQGTNIYQMNSQTSSAVKVNRVVYFYLEDREDARNIADCMIAQDAVVLLDMSKLDKEDSMCVLHFLDGVKYIYKSKMETIATNVYLVVPSSIELAGDFYDQISPGTFY